jgi:hypothetical protein
VEQCLQLTNRRLLLLLGNSGLKEFPKFKSIDFNNAGFFAEQFKEDSKVFYILELHDDKSIKMCERGVGYVDFNEEGPFFVRESPLYIGTNYSDLRPITSKKIPDFSAKGDECLVLSCTYPSTYLEALSIPNAVLTSSESPQITVLPNFSFLGRLEGNIEAITFSELKDCKEFEDLIKGIIIKTIGIPSGLITQTPQIEA